MSVVLSEFIPLFVGIILFDVGVFVNVVIPGNQRPCVVEGFHCVAAVDEIRVLSPSHDGAHSLAGCLSGQPCLFHFSPGLFCNNLFDFIVVIFLRAGNCKECGKLNHIPVPFGGSCAAPCLCGVICHAALARIGIGAAAAASAKDRHCQRRGHKECRNFSSFHRNLL